MGSGGATSTDTSKGAGGGKAPDPEAGAPAPVPSGSPPPAGSADTAAPAGSSSVVPPTSTGSSGQSPPTSSSTSSSPTPTSTGASTSTTSSTSTGASSSTTSPTSSDTASGSTTSTGSTDTASGTTSSAGSTDTASGSTTSTGSTDTASGTTSSTGSTDTASGTTSSTGSTDTASGTTSSTTSDTSSSSSSAPTALADPGDGATDDGLPHEDPPPPASTETAAPEAEPAPVGTSDWWFPHETARIRYTQAIRPPPLDLARADIHTGAEDGPVARSITDLQQTPGAHTLRLALSQFDPPQHSPLAIHFLFQKRGVGEGNHWCHAPLASPVPFRVTAEPTRGSVGTQISLRASDWGATVYDGHGADPRDELVAQDRQRQIPASVKSGLKWRLLADGMEPQNLSPTGEQIQVTLEEAHRDKLLWAQAYLGETAPALPPPAQLDVAHPRRCTAPIDARPAELRAPLFDAAARFRFHQGVLASREKMHLLWGSRLNMGGHPERWATKGPLHDPTCEDGCRSQHGGRWCVARCDGPSFWVAEGSRLDGVQLEEVTVTDADIARFNAAHMFNTWCNIGTSLCAGEAFSQTNLWCPRPPDGRMNANRMFDRYQTQTRSWTSLQPSQWEEARDIADCGGFVWVARANPGGTGHIWPLVSPAEHAQGTPVATALTEVPIFHVGAGKPRRCFFYGTRARGGGFLFFVSKPTWDLWQAFKTSGGDIPAAKQRARDAVDAARGGTPPPWSTVTSTADGPMSNDD